MLLLCAMLLIMVLGVAAVLHAAEYDSQQTVLKQYEHKIKKEQERVLWKCAHRLF